MDQKEMKRKLAAAACCLAVFAALLIWKVSGDRTRDEEPFIPAGAVTLTEVYRLLPEAEAMEGFPGEEETWLTREALEILFAGIAELEGVDEESIRMMYPDSGGVTEGGEGEDGEDEADRYCYPEDFLVWYEAYAQAFPENGREPVLLYVLKAEGEELVTDQGNFGLDGAWRYDRMTGRGGTGGERAEDGSEWEGQVLEAMLAGGELLYVRRISAEEVVLPNVWLISGEGREFEAYIQGVRKELTANAALEEEVESLVADLRVQNGLITGITIKSDSITGKVLMTDRDEIEIEGYGVLPLNESFRIYKIYGELGMEVTESILVGYENTRFVVDGDTICAALLTEPIQAENIRVLIGTEGYTGYYHEQAEFAGDGPLIVTAPSGETRYEEGEVIMVTEEMVEDGRIRITSESEDGKITITSLRRASGSPAYRGAIEVAAGEEGLLIINELALEEYLYAVIPSEMPVSYDLEALKVQAVCARSYAYNQLMANRFAQYGAHVDDSVACQVYNNTPESERSILAVKDTYGRVILSEDSVITAYYFSTSCGTTAQTEDVWAAGTSESYLTGRVQYPGEAGTDAGEKQEKEEREQEEAEALADEETFRDFLESEPETYDSGFAWYRWSVVLSCGQLEESINQYAAERFRVNPDCILTLDEETGEYRSVEPGEIGTITGIEVSERGTGGIITELRIAGSKSSLLIRTEYNIRTLLSPARSEVVKLDGSVSTGMSLLPSAFFVLDEIEQDGRLAGYRITGGGYGHGVGMSQNGAMAMAEEGNTWEEIIRHYYTGTTIGYIYE